MPTPDHDHDRERALLGEHHSVAMQRMADKLSDALRALRAERDELAKAREENERLRADAERLDWLEQELEHEQQALQLGLTPAPSLFRANLPITRAAIDEHRAHWARNLRPPMTTPDPSGEDPDDLGLLLGRLGL
jgi:hypothetical protein